MSSSSTLLSGSSSSSSPIRPADDVRADLRVKQQQLKRAWTTFLAPSRDGILGGRRRDNRGNVLRLIHRFEAEVEALRDELLKARAFEWWLEDVAERTGSWE